MMDQTPEVQVSITCIVSKKSELVLFSNSLVQLYIKKNVMRKILESTY